MDFAQKILLRLTKKSSVKQAPHPEKRQKKRAGRACPDF